MAPHRRGVGAGEGLIAGAAGGGEAVGGAGVGKGVDTGGAVLAEDTGALAGSGAGGNDVIEDGDCGALEGGTPVAEGAGDVLAAFGGAEADLAGGRAHAFEAARGGWDIQMVKQDLGLVESSPEPAAVVEGDGEDRIGGKRVDDGAEAVGHVGCEVADTAELEAVDDAAGGALHHKGSVGAVEVAPPRAVAAAPFVVAADATAGAVAGAARGHEQGRTAFAEIVAEGSAFDAARGVEQVEGAGEQGGHGLAR